MIGNIQAVMVGRFVHCKVTECTARNTTAVAECQVCLLGAGDTV